MTGTPTRTAPQGRRLPQVWAWGVLLGLVAVLSSGLAALGLPSPMLFGALAAGLAHALTVRRTVVMPSRVFTIGQAVLGVTIGAQLDLDTVGSLRADWLPVLGVCLATLALSVLAGLVLRLHPGVSAATGAFAMVAGGASGIVAVARELGADDRVVAVVQYLRVLLIVLPMPLVTATVFAPAPGAVPPVLSGTARVVGGAPPAVSGAGSMVVGVLFVVLCVAVGLVLADRVQVPASALLMPLIVAVLGSVLASTSGAFEPIGVPGFVQGLAFVVIGLQVGLRFTRASLRAVAGLLPLALVTISALIVGCAGLGVLLSQATGESRLDGYLATTPGGLHAALATTIGSGGDVTFVLAVQIVRLFAVLLAAPLLARGLSRTSRPRRVQDECAADD